MDILCYTTLGFARSLRLFNLASISMVVSAIALVKRSGGRLVSDLAANDSQRGQKRDPVRVEFVNLPALTDVASGSAVWLRLPGTAPI
ncbi:hypothetical protein, partial [Ferrimicrobium acidiphilum]|uniref:hypothetical protein n=1 Tax=Ferrimicrobium acidiphilum TaxID=121039 RepID=UPI0023F52F7B